MDKKEKLEKLTAENKYYDVEFIDKQKQNKKSFAQKIFYDFIQEFDNSEYSLNHQDGKVEILSAHNEFTIRLLTDIETNPKGALIFQISKTENDTKKRIVYLMRPNNISPFPKADFNRLLENPYKGMDLLDIEIVEQQKNIDFLKKYIADTFNYNDYNFYCENQTYGKSLGEFDTIKKLIKQIL
ncbi:MAG: hypothetical protein ABR595_10620 [Psychroflexus sp.]